jgi:hypothetical protein
LNKKYEKDEYLRIKKLILKEKEKFEFYYKNLTNK